MMPPFFPGGMDGGSMPMPGPPQMSGPGQMSMPGMPGPPGPPGMPGQMMFGQMPMPDMSGMQMPGSMSGPGQMPMAHPGQMPSMPGQMGMPGAPMQGIPSIPDMPGQMSMPGQIELPFSDQMPGQMPFSQQQMPGMFSGGATGSTSDPSESGGVSWMGAKPQMMGIQSVNTAAPAPPPPGQPMKPAGGLRAMLQRNLNTEKQKLQGPTPAAGGERLTLQQRLALRDQRQQQQASGQPPTDAASASTASDAQNDKKRRRTSKWDDDDENPASQDPGMQLAVPGYGMMGPPPTPLPPDATPMQIAAFEAQQNLGALPAVHASNQGPNAEQIQAAVSGLIMTPEQSRAESDKANNERFARERGYCPPGQPCEDWVCRCGFKNTFRNSVCGGNGPVGCKQDRSVCAQPGMNQPAGTFGGTVVNQQNKLKQVPCKFYEMGRCSKGAGCQFFHDPSIDPAALQAKGFGKEGKVLVPGCLFLPRVTEGLEAYHLQAYFSQYGKLNDIFGPLKKPSGTIAYVRFDDPKAAERVLENGEDHYIRAGQMVRAEQCYEREGKGKGKGPERTPGKDQNNDRGAAGKDGQTRYSYGSGGLSIH